MSISSSASSLCNKSIDLFSSDDLKAILSQPEKRIRITFGTLFFLLWNLFSARFLRHNDRHPTMAFYRFRCSRTDSDLGIKFPFSRPQSELESSMMYHLRVDFVFLPFHPFFLALFNAKWNPSLWHHRKNLFLHILAHSPNMFPLITQNSFSNENRNQGSVRRIEAKKSWFCLLVALEPKTIHAGAKPKKYFSKSIQLLKMWSELNLIQLQNKEKNKLRAELMLF